ncbi:MAG: AbrB family transcriptional regulator [Actinobacteria bacterium]|nr:AbrB family transcriptional regulator [Actinomycetota bacterium]
MVRMSLIHEFVAVQKRGVATIPSSVRRRLRLDEPGAQLEILETEDGRFEIRGVLPVDADQAWFWTDRWQRMEREADADFAAGRSVQVDSVEALLAELDS